MSEEIFLTRGEWPEVKGVHFIFVTIKRRVSGQEFAELCEKYFEVHQNITRPGEALWVDLRPAFSVLLPDVTPKHFSQFRQTILRPLHSFSVDLIRINSHPILFDRPALRFHLVGLAFS